MSTAASADAELNKAMLKVEVPEDLLAQVKASAALDKMTLREYVNAVLEQVVAEDKRFRLPRARAS